MSSSLIYLAGPIDYVDEDDLTARHWREEATHYLKGFEVAVYNPETALHGSTFDMTKLPSVHLPVVEACDGLLAYIDPTTPSWGTPIEIERARAAGACIALYCPEGPMPPYLRDLPTYDNLMEACDMLVVMLQRQTGIKEEAAGWNLRAINEGIRPPANPCDVGYDLVVQRTTAIKPGRWAIVPMGDPQAKDILKLDLPTGCWASVMVRSGVSDKLVVAHTVIDPGYKGPIYTIAFNTTPQEYIAEAGSRISQLVLFPTTIRQLEYVDTLFSSVRGEDGFGSTGT